MMLNHQSFLPGLDGLHAVSYPAGMVTRTTDDCFCFFFDVGRTFLKRSGCKGSGYLLEVKGR
jgi:hypothetical protein